MTLECSPDHFIIRPSSTIVKRFWKQMEGGGDVKAEQLRGLHRVISALSREELISPSASLSLEWVHSEINVITDYSWFFQPLVTKVFTSHESSEHSDSKMLDKQIIMKKKTFVREPSLRQQNTLARSRCLSRFNKDSRLTHSHAIHECTGVTSPRDLWHTY